MSYQNLDLCLANQTVTEMNYHLIHRKFQVHTIGGLSDHSDGVGTHNLSNEKVDTERVDCFPTDILSSEIVNKFITSVSFSVS